MEVVTSTEHKQRVHAESGKKYKKTKKEKMYKKCVFGRVSKNNKMYL
jgi:hypothetical protein